MEKQNIIPIIKKYGSKNKYKVLKNDGKTYILRLFLYHDILCEYNRRSRHMGHQVYDTSDWVSIKPDIETDDKKVARAYHNLDRLIKALETSHMWSDILETAKFLRQQNKETLLEYYGYVKTWGNGKKLLSFLSHGQNRNFSVDMFYNLFNPKCIVKIPCPLYDNYQPRLKEAIINKTDEVIRRYITKNDSYEHSLEVLCGKDGIMRGWYSKEYKNCANGYYYIMINDEYAMFCEKD